MDDNFAFCVAETALVLRREFDRRAAALGVTRAQWRVLARLGRQDGLRQVELAEALDVEPITLCRMIDRLADAGLVERRRDDQDRRAWRIHLTPRAGPVLDRLREVAEIFLDDALDGVSEAEQLQVKDALARVRANIAGSAAGRRAS
jgi:DNA-binding MarR family transcriptional regulator